VKPVVAVVGRANVGKSTLFNRLTASRDAIVADFAGLTRDRHYGDAQFGEQAVIVVDTGGFEPSKPVGVVAAMAKQTQQAIAESDAIIFVVDLRAGLTSQDHDIARTLRVTGKPVILAANKAEGMGTSPLLGECHELGMGEPWPISSAHGQGIRSLIDAVVEAMPATGMQPATDTGEGGDADALDKPLRIAVAGRPNVGKSTLINTWLGEERLIAFDQPGTTRDAIRVPLTRNGRHFELIDTAGIRRKGKVFEAIEKFSVVKTLQAIADANVVVLLLDASQDITDQDAHIAGYIVESGRAVVVAVNKWDAVDAYQRQMLERALATRLAFLKYAEVHRISALKRQGLAPLWQAMTRAHESATRKLPTPKLTRLLQEAVMHQAPPRVGAYRPKPRYAHQGGMNPPIVVVHGNAVEHLSDSYKRFLEGRVREAFKLVGTPLRIECRTSKNPFKD
jgi:GTPase